MPIGRLHEGAGSYHTRGLPHGGKIADEIVAEGDQAIEKFIRAMYFPPFEGAVVERQENANNFNNANNGNAIDKGDLAPEKNEEGVVLTKRYVCDTWTDYVRVREMG